MISFREFNKSKNSSVLLIHGLFSSSGFWLEYLKYFKDLRVIMCDINYEKFLNDPENLFKNISDFTYKNHIKNSIAHSFGSSINLKIPKDVMRFNICPTHFKSRKNKKKFITEICLKSKLDKMQINNLLTKVDGFLLNNKHLYEKNKTSIINFIPNNDSFFKYNEESNFAGDHFNIDCAVKKILKLNEFIK